MEPSKTSHLQPSLWMGGALLLLLIALNSLPFTQKISYDYLDDALERALTSFAIAKGLNAAISVAQGTQIAATPAGVGVTIAAGELLDPINDMVERFSWVMLASTVSLGIQKVIVTVTSSTAMQLLFVLLGVWSFYLFGKKGTHRHVVMRLFLLFVILRFSMPVMALCNHLFYENFQKNSYEQATQALHETQDAQETRIDDTIPETKEAGGMMASIKHFYAQAAQTLNVKQQINDLKTSLEQSFSYLIDLITIFIVQTMLLPLAYLYAVVLLIKKLFRSQYAL